MKFVKARIRWEISIKDIPIVLKLEDREKENAYTPIIIFENQYFEPIFEGNKSNVPLWSAVVFNDKIFGNESISLVSYLVDDAPYDFMEIGAKFKLYEGFKIVAQGEIIK